MLASISEMPSARPITADLCIVGAGAAGIAIARTFLGTPYTVVLLEAGGLKREPSVQGLYKGESIGEPYYQNLDECRSRYFGGSTNCWGGICTPLNRIDFERRPWVPWSGWPITYQDLLPFYQSAHQLCGNGPYLYEADAWRSVGLNPADIDNRAFDPFVWHFNTRAGVPLSFGKRFRAELKRAPNINVITHANVTELLTNESGTSVQRAVVKTLDGRRWHVRASVFVLASGGIENARLLLLSDGRHPGGLGNSRDLVGRFFQEHLQVPCGVLTASNRRLAHRYSQLWKLGSTSCLPGLALSPRSQAAQKTLNASISLDPLYHHDSAFMAFQKIRADLKAKQITQATLKGMWKVAREFWQLAPEAYRRFFHGARPQGDPGRFVVFARGEQCPNPKSRILLSRERDALGLPMACLDWRTNSLDRTAIRLAASFAGREFARLRLGAMQPAAWLSSGEWPEDLVGGPHHMGTTRMSDDPAEGVVDRNCKVHGLDGLYIAGSSVFPTGGHANPTLTILALASRLAETLHGVLAQLSEPMHVQSIPPADCASESSRAVAPATVEFS